MRALNFILLIALTLNLSGCLKTRAELEAQESGGQQQRQTTTQQREQYKEKAPATAYRFEEYDERMRDFAGKIEAVESQNAQLYSLMKAEREAAAKDKEMQGQKLKAYEEALQKSEAELQQLNAQVAELKASSTPPPKAVGAAPSKAGKSPFDEAEGLFSNRQWQEAVVMYEKYREQSPKGKRYSEATYKIGVCFQELGLKDEAKAFFDEVSTKFPKSKEAKKATFRMKSLR